MADERTLVITDADVRSLAAKLTGLHALLTPQEQEVLHALLRRAATLGPWREPAGEGLLWTVSFNPFTYLDAIDFNSVPQVKQRRREHA